VSFNEQHLTEINLRNATGAIEWSELTYQSKIHYRDVLLIIFLTHPTFSGVHGKIDHILNGIDHLLLKKAHETGGSERHGIGGSSRITEESVLNFPSTVSVRTTMLTFSDM
jgi:hypothetical protein